MKAHLRLGFTSVSKVQVFSAAPAFWNTGLQANTEVNHFFGMTSSKWHDYDWLYACVVREYILFMLINNRQKLWKKKKTAVKHFSTEVSTVIWKLHCALIQ